MRKTLTYSIGFCCLLTASIAGAQEVRYVQENGVTYREVERIERRPVTTYTVREREETVFTPRVTTEMRESQRTVYSPVVEYRYEPRMHGLLNPFRPPHIAYHMVPVTRWEARTEHVRTPVTYRELIPEKRLVQVPTRELSFVEQKKIERVAVSSAPERIVIPTDGTTVARQVGSTQILENDPPRHGARTMR